MSNSLSAETAVPHHGFLHVLGPPGSGRSELHDALETLIANSPQARAGIGARWSGAADADRLNWVMCAAAHSIPLWTCSAGQDHAALEEQLKTFVQCLLVAMSEGGQECEVGGNPVFLVLTRCDLLAQPGDGLKEWQERIDKLKADVRHLLRTLLPPHLSTRHPPFGSMTVRVRATALQRPVLADGAKDLPDRFGVVELFREAAEALRDLARRKRRQPRRLGILLSASIAVLIAMLAMIVWVVGAELRVAANRPDSRSPADLKEAWLTQRRQILGQANSLLHFTGYRTGSPPVTDWPRWCRDAAVASQAATELFTQATDPGQPVAEAAELHDAARWLSALRNRAALFGLAGNAAVARPILAFPQPKADAPGLDEIRATCSERVAELKRSFPNSRIEELPDQTPVGVAEELRRIAQANYERLLDPIRAELARRVSAGNKKETTAAWRELAKGYLANQAPAELADWRTLAMLLQRLAGRDEPRDPLEELSAFLREDAYLLPLETVTLQVPTTVVRLHPQDGIRPRIEFPLTIELRSANGDVAALRLALASSRDEALGGGERYRFVAIQPNPLSNGRLVFHPGDQLSATLRVFDKDGRPWQLTWSAAESRSTAYTFNALTQPPRIHAVEQTDPSLGSIAFGVRLIFSEPERFRLPELMPR